MSAESNNRGRAFEYACLQVLYQAISEVCPAEIVYTSSFYAAKSAWEEMDAGMHQLYILSAKSTIDTIFALEPNITEPKGGILKLYIQNDRQGELADVRDIIIERADIVWEIGLSIKHNHMAVKHSRLSKDIDFGDKWYNVKCSRQYWDEVKPIFDYLAQEKDKGSYFRELQKEELIYVPLLNAFIKEIQRGVSQDANAPRRLVEYLLSKYDFYKVISVDSKRFTTIQAFNMYGTLNRASQEKEPELLAPLIELPTELLYIDFKKNSRTTILLCFDNGWQFSFRIHNAESRVNTSLKFDIQIVGMPPEVNIKYTCNW